MAFIKVALDAKEAVIAPEGPYDLRISKCDEAKTGPKSKIPGEPMLNVMILNETPGPNGENYAPVFHTLMIPSGKTPEKNVDMYKLNIQRFLRMFNIPGSADGFDTDDFIGATASGATLTQEEGDDEVTRNKLKLERLPDDEEEHVAPRQGRAAGGPRGRRR